MYRVRMTKCYNPGYEKEILQENAIHFSVLISQERAFASFPGGSGIIKTFNGPVFISHFFPSREETWLTSLIRYSKVSLGTCIHLFLAFLILEALLSILEFLHGFDRQVEARFPQARLGVSPFCPCNFCSRHSMYLANCLVIDLPFSQCSSPDVHLRGSNMKPSNLITCSNLALQITNKNSISLDSCVHFSIVFWKWMQSKKNDLSQLRCLWVYSRVQQKEAHWFIGKKKCYYKSCIFLLFINVFILFKHEQFQMLGMQLLSLLHSVQDTLGGCYTPRNNFPRTWTSFTWGIVLISKGHLFILMGGWFKVRHIDLHPSILKSNLGEQSWQIFEDRLEMKRVCSVQEVV